jgi:chromosome partitioning protein
LLTVNALTAADAVVIPIQCEYYALEGLSQLIATINLVRNHLNPDLAIKGVVLTMYDPRTNLSAEVDAEVRKYLGPTVFDTIIPRSVRLSEAPSYGLPIALYRPDSKGAEAYAALAAELRARDGRPLHAELASQATDGATVADGAESEASGGGER